MSKIKTGDEMHLLSVLCKQKCLHAILLPFNYYFRLFCLFLDSHAHTYLYINSVDVVQMCIDARRYCVVDIRRRIRCQAALTHEA